MDAINTVLCAYDLKVIEDAAQLDVPTTEDAGPGVLADAAGFSFYPGKNLGAFGDGGAVTTNDDAVAEQLRLLRNYGLHQVSARYPRRQQPPR